MSTSKDSTNIALQTCFGIAGILSLIIALLGLHYKDSLGCVLCRRLRGRQAPGTRLADRTLSSYIHRP